MHNGLGKTSPEVVRALVRSENRRKILMYLSKHPKRESYLEEIVKETWISHSNVLGTIRGNGNKYSRKLSLKTLGLVRVIENNGFKYYKLTEDGEVIVSHLFSSYGEGA